MSYTKKANKFERLAIAGDFEKLLEHAEIGRPMAQLALARSIEAGLFEPEDDKKTAHYWINLAAKAGLPEAMLYLTSEGAERIHWLEKASELDYPFAMLELASLYYFGDGVEEDDVKHFQLTLEASRFDIPIALQRVGDSYMIGLGVEKNLLKAYEFYNRARDHSINPSYWNSASEFNKYCAANVYLGTALACEDESQSRNIQDRLVAVTLLIALEAGEMTEEHVVKVMNSLGENTKRLFDNA